MEKNENVYVSFDAALHFALEEGYRQEIAELPSNDELKKLYPDTSKWDEKILPAALKALNASPHKPHKRRSMKVLKAIFISVVLLLSVFACTMLVSAEARQTLANTIMEWADGGKGLFIRFEMEGTPLTRLPEGYGEHYIPEGFVFNADASSDSEVRYFHVYDNPEGLYIAISANIAENASATVVDAEYTTYRQITFNDTTYYLGEFTDVMGYSGCRILWLKDGIEHCVDGYVDLIETLKIVESIY